MDHFAGLDVSVKETSVCIVTSCLRHPPPRFATGSLILSRVSSLMFIGDCRSRTRPRVQIAKSAITRDHVRNAFLHSTVLAVPVHVSFEVYYCAPGGVTISSTGRSSEPRYRHSRSETNCQFHKGFCHDKSSLVLHLFFTRNTTTEN